MVLEIIALIVGIGSFIGVVIGYYYFTDRLPYTYQFNVVIFKERDGKATREITKGKYTRHKVTQRVNGFKLLNGEKLQIIPTEFILASGDLILYSPQPHEYHPCVPEMARGKVLEYDQETEKYTRKEVPLRKFVPVINLNLWQEIIAADRDNTSHFTFITFLEKYGSIVMAGFVIVIMLIIFVIATGTFKEISAQNAGAIANACAQACQNSVNMTAANTTQQTTGSMIPGF